MKEIGAEGERAAERYDDVAGNPPAIVITLRRARFLNKFSRAHFYCAVIGAHNRRGDAHATFDRY